MEYQNDYEVKLAQIGALQGSTAGVTNIFEADLEILKKLKEGGGGGAQIDDTTTALNKVWSSSKTNTEIQNAIAIGFKVQVVQELPATGQPKILYLVPKQTAATGDAYDEYIWTENGYEKIGSTEVDLSNYYTKAQTDAAISTGVSGLASTQNLTDDEEVIAQALYLHEKNKQTKLVSGENIKTVQGQSLIGSGNVDLSDVFASKAFVSNQISAVRAENDAAGEVIAQALWVLNEKIEQGSSAALNLANQILA